MHAFNDQSKMTRKDLSLFGIDETAYVRPIIVAGRKIHVIHAADGTLITAATDRELAFLTIRQNHMTPASVH